MLDMCVHTVILLMASSSRGQLPAWHTKAVDENQRPLKTGSPGYRVVSGNDVTSSKPQGRDVIDDSVTKFVCQSVCCGSRKCKTCNHLVEGNTFTSNVTGRTYDVSSPGMCMNCGTKSVIYLISCKKCGVQYVGETNQTLRCRFNNHRNRLKQLCGLYLYHHFSSDGHTLDDISIIPIEEVVSEPDDGITLGCKRLQREEFWYRELCTINISLWLE